MSNPLELNKADLHNYETLLRAVKEGQIALLSCEEKDTGRKVPTICAVNFDGEDYEFVPLARLFDSNPYEILNPPAIDDELGNAEVLH